MTTFLMMQTRIARELGNRSLADLLAEIKDEIVSAIAHYQRQPFYFTQSRSVTFSTVSGREFYGSVDSADIPDLPSIHLATLTVSGNRVPLAKASNAELEGMSATAEASGQPTHIAYVARQVRLYPVPNDAWAVQLTSDPRLTTLSADADTNVWLTEAEELIRSRAKSRIWRNVLEDPDQAALCEADELKALSALRRETRRRLHSAPMRADAALVGTGPYDITTDR